MTLQNTDTPIDEVTGDWVQDIADMHEKFGVRPVAAAMDAAQLKTYLKFRLEMLQEEVDEAFKGFHDGDADGVVDALIDACVFAIGTLDVMRVDSYEAWDRVHGKNMEKSPGIKKERPNPFGFPDLIKPEGWTPPSHEDNVGLIGKALGSAS